MKLGNERLGAQIAALLIVMQVLFGGGSVAFAQTTTDLATTPEAIVEVPADPIVVPQTDGTSADLQGASSTPALQETFTEQDTVSLTDTMGDEELTLATTTDAVPPEETPADTATTTDEVTDPEVTPADETPVDETPPEVVADTPPVEDVPPPQPEPQPEAPVVWENSEPMVISVDELEPEPEYTFSINHGKKLTSSRRALRTETLRGKTVTSVVSETIDTLPQIDVDNTSGVMTVSGACEDKYYVILLYRHAEDYSTNKRSYIVNRAYPCEGGTFSYDIATLPTTLEDGNYYLLVAKMGDDTPWEPITALTEITLARN